MAPRALSKGLPSWFVLALAAAASFAAMAACVRLASMHLPLAEVVFFRNFLALVLLAPWMRHKGVSLATQRFPLHLLRALAGLSAMALYFHAISALPLADAILLNYTSPLFVALVAIVWLHERPSRQAIAALVLGFVGVAVLFHPSSAVASAAGASGLASGALAGLALASVKRLSSTEPPERIVAWFALLATLVSMPFALAHFQWPKADVWWFIVGMGAFGTLGQLAMTRAYELGSASHVAPVGYTSLIFAALIGWLIWRETLDASHLLGGVLIAFAGWLVRRPVPAPPSATPMARW